MRKITFVVALLTFAFTARAQQSQSIYYYSASGHHLVLHFPRIHFVGTDTTRLTGLAERFTSPFATTYLDSLDLAYALPYFVDVPGNDYEVYVMGSTHDSTGEYLIADTSNILFHYERHPSVADTNSGRWLQVAVPHVFVDSAFFVVLEITDTNNSDIEFGIGIDSIASEAQRPVDDNYDRCREYGAGSQQFYLAGNHFEGSRLFWYSNAIFIAHVSDTKSDVAQLTPTGFSLQPARPNPASQSITLKYTLPFAESITIHIFDEAGRSVKTSDEGVQPKGACAASIDISMLPAGSYRYTLLAGNESLSGAFDKLH